MQSFVWLILKSFFDDKAYLSYAIPRLILGLKITQIQPNLYISNSSNLLLNNFIARISANKFKTVSGKHETLVARGNYLWTKRNVLQG